MERWGNPKGEVYRTTGPASMNRARGLISIKAERNAKLAIAALKRDLRKEGYEKGEANLIIQKLLNLRVQETW